jgi:hypothetical protein
MCRVYDNNMEALRSLQGFKNMGGERFSLSNTVMYCTGTVYCVPVPCVVAVRRYMSIEINHP